MAPTPIPFVGVSTKGAMARSVSDVAFGLSVMAGADARDPQSFASDPPSFAGPLDRDCAACASRGAPTSAGCRSIARVRTVLDAQRKTFEDLGCIVEEACPDFGNVDEIFLTLRTWASWNTYKELLAQHRAQIKPEAIWDIESGAQVTGEDVGRALIQQGQLIERMRAFQQKYEFLICAVNQVPPFDAAEPWPKSIDGVAMENYVAWMKTAYWISTTCCPAISVPAGFTDEGLPVGMQIVGRYRDDLGVLKIAHAFEQATGFGEQRPPRRMSPTAPSSTRSIIARQSPEMAKLTKAVLAEAAAAVSRRGRAGLRQATRHGGRLLSRRARVERDQLDRASIRSGSTCISSKATRCPIRKASCKAPATWSGASA